MVSCKAVIWDTFMIERRPGKNSLERRWVSVKTVKIWKNKGWQVGETYINEMKNEQIDAQFM